MVSFRFHIVSLIGVFLALSIGIAIGATVVDKATVDQLEKQVKNVDSRAAATNAANDRLRGDVGRWESFAEQTGNDLVAGRLTGVDVLVIGMHGIDRDPVDRLKQSLVAAGARVQGTLWFSSKLKLDDPAQVNALADALVVASGPADVIRRSLVERLASLWSDGTDGASLDSLRAAGFLDVDAPIPSIAADTRFVVVSDAKADVPNDLLAIPLAAALAARAPARVLAVEAGHDAPVFVVPLRENGEVNAKLSSVDDLESYRGRVAAVLALDDLGPQGKVGHFGVGPHASRLVPEPAR